MLTKIALISLLSAFCASPLMSQKNCNAFNLVADYKINNQKHTVSYYITNEVDTFNSANSILENFGIRHSCKAKRDKFPYEMNRCIKDTGIKIFSNKIFTNDFFHVPDTIILNEQNNKSIFVHRHVLRFLSPIVISKNKIIIIVGDMQSNGFDALICPYLLQWKKGKWVLKKYFACAVS